MKFNQSRLLIMAVCAVLGFLLISQISFGKIGASKIYTFQSYRQAVSELNKLNGEVNLLKIKKSTLEQNLSSISNKTTNETIKQFDEDLTKYSFTEGLSEVKGPGIIITLSDSISADPDSNFGPFSNLDIVHNSDLYRLVWELKNQSAEAISINGQRIVSVTGIYCAGTPIMINGERLMPPYEIRAIGDPAKLAAYMEKSGSLYKEFESRKLVTHYKRYDTNSIKIPEYTGSTEFKYAKSEEK